MQNPSVRGDWDEYTTYEDYSGAVHFNIDPTGDPNGVSYSSQVNMPWSVNQNQAFAEVQNQDTQTSGTTSSEQYFNNTQFLGSGTWTNANFNSGSWQQATARNGAVAPQGSGPTDSFSVWDTRY
jgi:hypothetical protein